jgi:hypothetical protein
MVAVHNELNDAKLRLGIRMIIAEGKPPQGAASESTTMREAM